MDALTALNLSAPIADTYNEVEEILTYHIAEQLAANSDTLINATSEWRIKMLAQMGKLNRYTAKLIASKVGKVPAEVEKVVNTAILSVLKDNALEMTDKLSDNISNALKSYDSQTIISKYNQVNTVMQYKAKRLYADSVNQVASVFDRIQQKTLANSQEFLDVLNKNALATVVGEKSRTEALRETIREMCGKGIPAFIDAGGKEWSPEAYVNMDIRNTAKNAANAAQFGVMDELGQDVILVSAHAASRPKCAPYQGKLFSRSGKSGTITDANGKTYSFEPLSSTSYGEPDGLFGINCGHTMRGVANGTFINREEAFPQRENSEEYEKVQHQRHMERQIRSAKVQQNALEAAGDTEGAKALDQRISAKSKQLKEYCDSNKLSYRRDRTEIYGYKTVDIPEVSGIIKTNIEIGRSLSAAAKNYPVKLLGSNQHVKLAEGQTVTGKVFAGKGTNVKIRDRYRLESDYHIAAKNWQKVSGNGKIIENGKEVAVELHWYEADGEIVEMKVKRYLDES